MIAFKTKLRGARILTSDEAAANHPTIQQNPVWELNLGDAGMVYVNITEAADRNRVLKALADGTELEVSLGAAKA